MRIGLFCLFERFEGGLAKAINDQLRLVELADEMGFDEAWFGEHHFNDFSVCPSPSLLLANAIARTKTIRLGCAGYLAPFYDAVRLAEEVATLDNLSGGRINLGFAKGAFAPDSKHFKVQPENLRKAMFECVDAISNLLQNNDSDFTGDFVNYSNVDIEPRLIQSKIPTYIATFSSPQTIEFAAKRGFALMISQGASLEDCEKMSDYYKSIARCTPKIVLMRTFCVADTDEKATAMARPAIDHFVKSMKSASSFSKSPTYDRQKYAALVNERATFFDGSQFFDCGIIGNAATCIEQIQGIKNTLPNVTIALKPVGASYEENSQMLRILNEQIRQFC
jgi:alkanesulfonate monooxygenase SsuD/methylene tetrahydromethanopterin reductase-like flavin-dependent oxidoreductase (luciferase family)